MFVKSSLHTNPTDMLYIHKFSTLSEIFPDRLILAGIVEYTKTTGLEFMYMVQSLESTDDQLPLL